MTAPSSSSTPSSPRAPWLGLRFLFVTGKGGVGKTTAVAALAERLVAEGRRVLVAVTSPKERVSSLLGDRALTPDIREVRPRLFGVLLDADTALKEYGTMVLKSERLASALFDNALVRGFFHGAPGLKEWALLGKAWYHSTEVAPGGGPRFDTVILDAPATGHGLDMLRVPKTIVELAPPGVLRADAERAWNQFQNPRESGVVLVTLPEEMPTTESLELADGVQRELGLPLAAVLVNQVVPVLFDAASQARLAALAVDEATSDASRAVAAAVRRAAREQVQAESLARLNALSAPRYELPFLPAGVTSHADVRALARLL